MSIIWATLRKEVQEVLRDKRTLLLTVLVPMVFYPALILLAGGLDAKQKSKEKEREIKLAVHFAGDRLEAEDVVNSLSVHDSRMKWFPSEADDPKKLLSSGECDVYARLFSFKDKEGEPMYWKVQLHYLSTARGDVDVARVIKAFNQVKSVKVMAKLGKVIEVKKFKDHATVRQSAGSKFGGAAAYFLVFLAFTGCLAVAVDVAAGEKERGTLEAMLVTPASFWDIAFGKLLFVVIMGLLSVLSTGIGIGAMVLIAGRAVEGMSLGGVGFMSILGIIALLLELVFFFAVILFGLSILAKSSKEAHMRSSLLMLVIAMALVYCALPGVELTGGLLFVPVLNVAMALRGLWEGSLSFADYLIVISTLGIQSLVILWLISAKVKSNAENVLLK